jgi:hypothetical protein
MPAGASSPGGTSLLDAPEGEECYV